MTARPRVVVVGDVGLDVLATVSASVVFGQDTRARIRATPGGAGGNTAAWLAREDLDVSLIARVGHDAAGRRAAAELAAAGVDCRFAIDPTLPTCCVVVLITPDGERTMVSDRGANAALAPPDVIPSLAVGSTAGRPDRRGHLHLSGYVLLDPGSRAAGLVALQCARDAGWTTSVDPQAATHIAAAGAAEFLRWIGGTDLLLPNDSELAALGGCTAVLAAVKAVAVTHGCDGASWHGRSGRIDVPAPEVHQVDSTGAGDAFNAGLLGAWLHGADPITALGAAVARGTAAAAHLGARPAETDRS